MSDQAVIGDQGKQGASVRSVRRIVTGHTADGKSTIISDGPTPCVNRPTGSSLIAQVPWITGEGAASGPDPAPAGHLIGFHSAGGTVLRIVDFPPDGEMDEDQLKHFLDENHVRDTEKPRHFWFHKTESLDYAICLEGEIYAMLDEGEALMQSGDVLVQRATNHSWSNRSKSNCRMAFVLIALDPGAQA